MLSFVRSFDACEHFSEGEVRAKGVLMVRIFRDRLLCADREVAEILRRMQRAERHERMMRAKLNSMLAELRGGRIQGGSGKQPAAIMQGQSAEGLLPKGRNHAMTSNSLATSTRPGSPIQTVDVTSSSIKC